MRNGIATRSPGQCRIRTDIDGAVGRFGLAGLGGNVHEADFAEAILRLRQHPDVVTAVDGQADILGGDAVERDCRVGGVVGLGRRLGKRRYRQGRPLGSVDGILDRGVLKSETEHQLERHVVVPDEHLV